MSLIVVGGHTRNIGKTSVAAGLIAALPRYNWTAMKITQHGHGICSAVGEPCDCAVEYDHPYAISEESAPGASDSARFLTAGARRSFWLRTAVGQLGSAAAEIRRIVESSENMSRFLLGDVDANIRMQQIFHQSVRRFWTFGCLRPSGNMSGDRAVSKANAPASVLARFPSTSSSPR